MASNDLVQSLLRGLDILSLVGDSEGGIRLNDLSERMGLKKTTVYNLARTLAARNFVKRDNESGYTLGPAVIELANKYTDKNLEHQALAVMQRMVQELPASTIVFGMDSGAELYLKLRYSPDKPNVLQKPQGQTFQPYANGVGLVYLAFGSEAQITPLQAAYPFFEFGAHLWKTQAKLDEYLQEVRTQGCAIVPFDRETALRVSAPVLNQAGELAAVLGTSTPSQTLDPAEEKRLVQLTIDMAREIKI
jgi:DNA-binding IclR family transcriptional regulator